MATRQFHVRILFLENKESALCQICSSASIFHALIIVLHSKHRDKQYRQHCEMPAFALSQYLLSITSALVLSGCLFFSFECC